MVYRHEIAVQSRWIRLGRVVGSRAFPDNDPWGVSRRTRGDERAAVEIARATPSVQTGGCPASGWCGPPGRVSCSGPSGAPPFPTPMPTPTPAAMKKVAEPGVESSATRNAAAASVPRADGDPGLAVVVVAHVVAD